MSYPVWRRVAWCCHLLFALAVTWPGQTLVNAPAPFVLGLPRQMAWVAAWIVASLLVMWRLDAARNRQVAHGADVGRDGNATPRAGSDVG